MHPVAVFGGKINPVVCFTGDKLIGIGIKQSVCGIKSVRPNRTAMIVREISRENAVQGERSQLAARRPVVQNAFIDTEYEIAAVYPGDRIQVFSGAFFGFHFIIGGQFLCKQSGSNDEG